MDQDERERIRLYLQKLFGKPVSSKRVASISANPPYHGVPTLHISEGVYCADMEPGQPSLPILAIFESVSYLVVSPGRGDGQGMPFIFPKTTITHVKYAE